MIQAQNDFDNIKIKPISDRLAHIAKKNYEKQNKKVDSNKPEPETAFSLRPTSAVKSNSSNDKTGI